MNLVKSLSPVILLVEEWRSRELIQLQIHMPLLTEEDCLLLSVIKDYLRRPEEF